VTAFQLHAALTTPFGADGSVDLEALRAHVELLADDGLDGLVPAGTTGEGPLLEEAEVATVVATVVRASARRMEVIAHVGRASTAATIRLGRAAVGAGADGLMAVVPYYYEHGPEALLAHYCALLEAFPDTPLLAYTFPDRTGNELPAEVLDTLAGEGLAGLKDSTSSAERHAEYLDVARRHEGLRVFVGAERLILQCLDGGGAGTISGLANARARVLALARDERSEAALQAVGAARDELPGIPALKRAVSERLAERGASYPTAPRPPIAV
jgi:4-hydroxy-tetrahydrodipicolinate synthase